MSAAPQSAQNFFPGGFSLPQALQLRGSGEPQSPQKFLPFATFAPQRGQDMRSSLMIAIRLLQPARHVKKLPRCSVRQRRYSHLLWGNRSYVLSTDHNITSRPIAEGSLLYFLHLQKGNRYACHSLFGRNRRHYRPEFLSSRSEREEMPIHAEAVLQTFARMLPRVMGLGRRIGIDISSQPTNRTHCAILRTYN